MRQRCLNPRDTNWARYGGAGVKICPEWLGVNGYARFVADLGERPKGTSLDRINPSGDYTKSNCRWSDQRTEGQNRRNVKLSTAHAELIRILAKYLPRKELVARFGVSSRSIGYIIARQRWPDDYSTLAS
jgi:hypothetical protein